MHLKFKQDKYKINIFYALLVLCLELYIYSESVGSLLGIKTFRLAPQSISSMLYFIRTSESIMLYTPERSGTFIHRYIVRSRDKRIVFIMKNQF